MDSNWYALFHRGCIELRPVYPGALASSGSAAVGPNTTRLASLWRVVFPRDGDSTKNRDLNAWRLALEVGM